jgi:hypothetical protein
MIKELSKLGLAYQIVLTKLDRAPSTLWTQLSTAMKKNTKIATGYNTKLEAGYNTNIETGYKSTVRILSSETRQGELKNKPEMDLWRTLGETLGLGCDERILGVSSQMGWGLTDLRFSILKACWVFGRFAVGDLHNLRDIPGVEDRRDEKMEGEWREEGLERQERKQRMRDLNPRFQDDNPMRGEVFGGKERGRKMIYRW